MVEGKKHPIKASKKEFLSLLGSNKNKSTAKDTATATNEDHANLETAKYITKDFAEKLIREKVKNAINTSHSDIKDRIEEIVIKLYNKLDQKAEHSIDVSRADIESKIEEITSKISNEFDQKVTDAINASRSDIEKKIEESAINLSNELDQKAADTINKSRSGTEGQIEESITRLSKAFDEKIKLKSNNILSNLRDEYRKQTEDLLNTAKSTTLANRIYVIGIGSAFVVVIIVLSLIGYSKIKSAANDTVMIAMESQANMKASKYVTTDIAETFIKEKAEYTIYELRQELDDRLKEETDKILGKLESDLELKNSKIPSDLHGEYINKTEVPLQTTKKEESLESLPVNSSEVTKGAVTNKRIQATPEKTLASLLEYKDVLTKKKTEREYIFEGRHKEGFNESSNANNPPSITFLSDAIELNPNNQNAYRNRGDAYYSLKQYKKAIADYNKTIEFDPQNVIAYGRRGDAYGKLQQYENAIIDYDKSVDLDPDYAPAYNNRGNALYTIRHYEKAIEDYTKTIELDPGNDTVYSNRGLAYSGLEQYEKAIEDYIKAIELAPEDTYNYIYLSRLNIITGNHDSALAVITKALYLPINTGTKAIALYIECVVKRLLGRDTSLSEREFSEIIKDDFTIWWDFSKLDSWLENADIDDETKVFIKEKSKLLATHLV